MKLLTWLPAIVATVLGIVEAILKVLKELLTLVVDILFPVIPIAKFKAFVTWLRGVVDIVYDWVSKIKEALLKVAGL